MPDRINLDFNRENRLGFPEAVYGANKDIESLAEIIRRFIDKKKSVLVTRLQPDKYEMLKDIHQPVFYDKISGLFVAGAFPDPVSNRSVGVISAGTTDAYVVNEIYYTLKFHGVEAEKIQDIGVAGLHRLLNRLDDLSRHSILIVVAGFEGALPSVVGGLLPQPVIAVPTSIGYGVAENGHVALKAMLASCASGITVVNIDNGYGAAIAAFRILNTVQVSRNEKNSI
jgi:pyridinium-3,5-biscarboxylic acid mononucleotide synthase